MNSYKYKDIIEKLFNNEHLTENEVSQLDDAALDLLNQKKDGVLDPDLEYLLDVYIEYYSDKERKRDKTKQIISEYQNISNNSYVKEANNKPKTLSLTPLKDQNGAIKIVTILEIILVFGILIAVLIIALLKK